MRKKKRKPRQEEQFTLLGWTPELENAYQEIWINTTQVGDCLLYNKKPNTRGYGVMKVHGKSEGVHRIVLMHSTSPRPEEWEAGHLCGNRMCVNIEHLVWVTKAENARMRECEKFLRAIHGRIGHNPGARLTAPLPITLNLAYFSEALELSALFQ